MPWLIQHKCNPDQGGLSPYSIQMGAEGGIPLTKIACPARDCREEFFIMGHEMFDSAEATDQDVARHARPNLPPGFVIASRKTPGG